MFAYIPARGGSQRIARKNIKTLGGKPIIVHVIQALQAVPGIDRIHVSTDDREIRAIAEAHGAVCLEPRSSDLSNSKAGFIDLIREDIPRYIEANGGTSEVVFALATAALVPAAVYSDAISAFQQNRPDVLMSCESYDHPVWWAFRQKQDGFWTPIFPDKVQTNSQDLPPALTDSGLFYVFDQKVLSRFPSHKLVDKLLPYEVPAAYRCDIDTPEDWERLEWKYHRLHQATSWQE
ncbi:MAG: acylneuraminate cytidylyltransferase family protein [Ferrovibrio sp.]|uniref:acylneuraminate cytidylyltransferase family protein n=1 Tax=Ferrovibrio sp. TaxID=1917215 RepID=UPI002634A2E3|nr:acylneuraminate cytidylyltransferase family protein [Ferrovibrio sp.]MCW0234949.1 acylneuraminate cytidylyltransferase family protein [Ferrovibrio sp.]